MAADGRLEEEAKEEHTSPSNIESQQSMETDSQQTADDKPSLLATVGLELTVPSGELAAPVAKAAPSEEHATLNGKDGVSVTPSVTRNEVGSSGSEDETKAESAVVKSPPSPSTTRHGLSDRQGPLKIAPEDNNIEEMQPTVAELVRKFSKPLLLLMVGSCAAGFVLSRM